jgi:hypothetical protein
MLWGGLDRIRLTQSFCEHGNEPSDSTNCGEFLDHLSAFLLFHEVFWSMALLRL